MASTWTGDPAPVRWRDDVGWEFRCESCKRRGVACFWPLTKEFWDPKSGMRQCRACRKAEYARRLREKYKANTDFRDRRNKSARSYRQAHKDVERIKNKARWARIKSDPVLLEAARERGRETNRRYRERRKAA